MALTQRVPDSVINWAARSEGVDPRLLKALLTQESGLYHVRGGRLVGSSAGAQGAAQLMPGTARGLGVNPRDMRQNVRGGARYLSQQLRTFGGSVPKALAAYNAGPGAVRKYGGIPPYAETRNYVARITSMLGQRFAPSAPEPPGVTPGPGVPGGTVEPGDVPRDTARRALLERALSGWGSSPTLRAMVADKASVGDRPTAPSPGPAAGPFPAAPGMPMDDAVGGSQRLGRVVGAPIDRPGVRTRDSVVEFVRRISGITGEPIQLGTGTRHNRMSTSGRQSAHWTGGALDLPASGARLTRMGQAALIAAGMPPAIARKQRGGLFNVGRHQIIFNTNVGGNHYDHLHVGERGA